MKHAIRLRAGWELWEGAAPAEARRVDLPAPRSALPRGSFRMRRRFGAPRQGDANETFWLRLNDVPGLRGIWLNGACCARPEPGTRHVEIRVPGTLASRNLLELEVDVQAEPEPNRADPAWGSIALVIKAP